MVNIYYYHQQQAYSSYDRGEITYTQFKQALKQMDLDIPDTKYNTFKELLKLAKSPKKSVPSITISLQDQQTVSHDNVFNKSEAPVNRPPPARRIVTLQDSPIHKNETSYVFSNSTKKKDLRSQSRDGRLVGAIYLEKKRSIQITNFTQNENIPASPRAIQSCKKNESSVKTGEGLYSHRQCDKRFLFNVQNKEVKGSGDIIKNQYTNIIKPIRRNLQECQHKWNN